MVLKRKKLPILVLLAAGTFFPGAQAQELSYRGAFMVEKDIETPDGAFPLYDEIIPGGRRDYTLDELFYSENITMRPAGWTEDGLFSCQYVDSYGKKMNLTVVDTVTDEIIGGWTVGTSSIHDVWDYRNQARYYFRDWEEEKMGLLLGENSGAPERLKANRQLVDVPLALAGQDTPPLPFPLESGRLRYDCWFNYTIEKAQTGDFRSLVKWRLYVGNGRRSKVVASGEYKTGEQSLGVPMLKGRKILGYYKSPFENRIVIVVHRVEVAAETSVDAFDYYGCHLDAGF
jgi:hypothetical protein